MGRSAVDTLAPVDLVEVLPAAAAAVVAAQDVLAHDQAHIRAVALQVGYQLPADSTDPDLIQRDIAANMRRSVEACLEVGRGLTALKAACAHGEFGKRLEILNLEDRVARRFMQAAAKFTNRALTPGLAKAIGNQTKLFELLILDDEQIDDLALSGQTGDLCLDDISTMSVKELRKALRQERLDNQFIAEKREKAEREKDALEREIRQGGPRTRSLDEQMVPFMQEVGDRQVLIEEAIGKHAESIIALDAWWTQHVTSQPDYDPQVPAPMPAEVLAVASKLYDDVGRMASMVAAMQARVRELFEQDILESRQHVLPAGGSDV